MKYSDLTPEQKQAKNAQDYESRKAYYREHYRKNRETILAKNKIRCRERYAANPDKYKNLQKAYYRNNIEARREYNRKYDRKSYILSTEERRKKQYVYQVRSRAHKNGIPCSITHNDLVFTSHCPLLGIELDYSMSSGYNPNHASVDRIEPSLGYVPGNVWMISRRANVMKNDASLEELQMFADNLKRFGLIK